MRHARESIHGALFGEWRSLRFRKNVADDVPRPIETAQQRKAVGYAVRIRSNGVRGVAKPFYEFDWERFCSQSLRAREQVRIRARPSRLSAGGITYRKPLGHRGRHQCMG